MQALSIFVTVRNGQIRCLEVLVRHGAVCTPSKDGVHPLDICIKASILVCAVAVTCHNVVHKGSTYLCVSCTEIWWLFHSVKSHQFLCNCHKGM